MLGILTNRSFFGQLFGTQNRRNFLLLLFLFVSPIGHTQTANVEKAKSFLNGLIELSDYQRQNKNPATPEIRQKIKTLSSNIDFNSLAQKSMTSHWIKLSKTEKAEFMQTLQALLEEVAYPNAKKVSAHKNDISYVSLAGGRKVVVSGTLERPKKGEIVLTQFEIVLHYKKGLIVDATLEGELLSTNLKKQFDKAFQKQSFAEILKKMKDRVASAKSSGNTKKTAG